MTVTRFALPVRSPTPFIVPWTCVAPARTAASVFATPQPASSWQWMPIRSGADLGDRVGHRAAISSAATSRSCRTAPRARRPPRRRRARTPARRRGRRGRRRRSARRRRSRACPRPRGRRRSRRSSPGSPRAPTRTTFSRCRPHVLPTIVQTGREALGEHAQARVLGGGDVAPARHPEGGDRPTSSRSPSSSAKSSASLGFDAGKPASMSPDAELVELAHDAQLLLGRQGQARPLHAVAQGGVVELDRVTG